MPFSFALYMGPRGQYFINRGHFFDRDLDVQARKLYLEFFLWFGGPGERSQRMETGVLHRISMRVS